MFTQIKRADVSDPYLGEFVVDTEAEVKELPTHFAPGSTCICIANSSVYMLSNSKEWKKL